MSTLTSLVKSGKRKIIKTRTPLGVPDQRVSQDPLRPAREVPRKGPGTPLGFPDQGVSQDPMRPAREVPRKGNMAPLGQPDQGISEDPMRPRVK